MGIISILDLIGTFTFAISGALSAAERKFDLLGALFIGFITAVGGGTVRDMLMGSTPVFWLNEISYTIVIFIAIVVALIFYNRLIKLKRALSLFDTIGIGVFTLIGIQKSLLCGISPVFAIGMGAVTAVMGGIFRDVFCNDVPLILHKEVYAMACLSGGLVYFLLDSLDINENITIFATVISVITIRLISLKYKLSIPKIHGD